MAYQTQFADTDEQIHDTDFEVIANAALYNVLDGCAATDSASDLTVTVAAGSVTVSGAVVTVAGDDVTLVPDGTNPRYASGWADNTGAVGISHGAAAANPQKPELTSDQTLLFTRKLSAGQTLASNSTLSLDKRLPAPSKLPTATAPGVTAEGVVQWDSDDDVFVVGTGSSTKRIGAPSALGSAAQEFIEGAVYKAFHYLGSGNSRTWASNDVAGIGFYAYESGSGTLGGRDGGGWAHDTGSTSGSNCGFVGSSIGSVADDWSVIWRGSDTGSTNRNVFIGYASGSTFVNGNNQFGLRKVNSGNFFLFVDNGGTETTVDLGVDGVTEVALGFIVSSGGTSIQGYVNGVATGVPITTNIPTASGWRLNCGLSNSAAETKIGMITYDLTAWREV